MDFHWMEILTTLFVVVVFGWSIFNLVTEKSS